MNKIIEVSPEIDIKEQERAEEYHKEVLARTIITANNLLELGRLFKTIRDEKLYKLLGANSFTEYCGYPEVSFGKSTIYSFIKVYERYVLRLRISPTELSLVGHRKLQIINPVVEDNPRHWLDLAHPQTGLSESDLINEVRQAQNKPQMIPKEKERIEPQIYDFNNYIAFIRAHPCIICGERGVDAHHFPRTKRAGEKNSHRIPLCRMCHKEAHDDPYDFLWQYRDKIFSFFYDTFLKAFALFRNDK